MFKAIIDNLDDAWWMLDAGHPNITIAKIIKIANKNKTNKNKYNKQIADNLCPPPLYVCL